MKKLITNYSWDFWLLLIVGLGMFMLGLFINDWRDGLLGLMFVNFAMISDLRSRIEKLNK